MIIKIENLINQTADLSVVEIRAGLPDKPN